jgi:hypothetical protein
VGSGVHGLVIGGNSRTGGQQQGKFPFQVMGTGAKGAGPDHSLVIENTLWSVVERDPFVVVRGMCLEGLGLGSVRQLTVKILRVGAATEGQRQQRRKNKGLGARERILSRMSHKTFGCKQIAYWIR